MRRRHRWRCWIYPALIVWGFAGQGASAQTVYEPGWAVELFASVPHPYIGIDFDAAGNVYVANWDYSGSDHHVYKINPQGTPVPFGDSIQLSCTLAMDSNGVLHTSSIGGEIYRIQPDGTTTVFVDEPEISLSYGMGFDSADNLFTIPWVPYTICKILPSGGIEYCDLLSNGNFCLALDQDDRIFIAWQGQNQIYEYEHGQNLSPYVLLPIGGIEDLAFDSTGNLYVLAGLGALYKVAPDLSITLFADGFDYPTGVAVDDGGRIYVACWQANELYRLAPFTPTPTASSTPTGSPTPTPAPPPIPSIGPLALLSLLAILGGLLGSRRRS